MTNVTSELIRDSLFLLYILQTSLFALRTVTRSCTLIDTDLHGYNGELTGGSSTKRGGGERVEFECGECGPQSFRVWVRSEYPSDLFDADFEDCRGREQDLFSWFSVVGRCPVCTHLLSITDFECT